MNQMVFMGIQFKNYCIFNSFNWICARIEPFWETTDEHSKKIKPKCQCISDLWALKLLFEIFEWVYIVRGRQNLSLLRVKLSQFTHTWEPTFLKPLSASHRRNPSKDTTFHNTLIMQKQIKIKSLLKTLIRAQNLMYPKQEKKIVKKSNEFTLLYFTLNVNWNTKWKITLKLITWQK